MADIPARLKIRRGSSVQWLTVNPTLADGELGFESDTNKLRIGDGITPFSSLPYFFSSGAFPDLGTYDPSLFVGSDAAAYSGDLNTLTGRKLVAITTGFSNAWAGAAAKDFVFHFDFDATNAMQIGFSASADSLIYRRAKVANAWGVWAAAVSTGGAQTITGDKTFTGSTVIDTLLSTLLDGGYTTTERDDGVAGATYEPDPLDSVVGPGNMRKITNSANFGFIAPTQAGSFTLTVRMVNSATAGTVTITGFSKVYGDALTTTDGDEFIFQIVKTGTKTCLVVQALQ